MSPRGAAYDKHRRIGAELRRLREVNGVSGRELARRIFMSQSKLSRIELGAVLPSTGEVTAWAAAVEAPQETPRLLDLLTDIARARTNAWHTERTGHGALHGWSRPTEQEMRAVEQAASRVCVFQPFMVPQLLQLPDYAQRVLAMTARPTHSRIDVPAAVVTRMDRQTALHHHDAAFEFLLTDAALLWRPGTAHLQQMQLDRIAALTTMTNVAIGVIPLARIDATTIALHPFTIIETPQAPCPVTVLIDVVHATLRLQAPDQVVTYRQVWAGLRAMARFGDQARVCLAELDAQATAARKAP